MLEKIKVKDDLILVGGLKMERKVQGLNVMEFGKEGVEKRLFLAHKEGEIQMMGRFGKEQGLFVEKELGNIRSRKVKRDLESFLGGGLALFVVKKYTILLGILMDD